MHTVILSLGSNLGNRSDYLQNARHALGASVGSIVQSSSRYETAPWGKTDQAPFLNQVIVLQSKLAPVEILSCIHSIEGAAGRSRKEKWGPRTLDIDILFYDSLIIRESDLEIPHPGIPERRFVLEPLSEIMPGLVHPVNGQRIDALLSACPDTSKVRKLPA